MKMHGRNGMKKSLHRCWLKLVAEFMYELYPIMGEGKESHHFAFTLHKQ